MTESTMNNGSTNSEKAAAPISPSKSDNTPARTPKRAIALAIIILILSVYTCPETMQPSKPSVEHVFYYGWISALSTGLGVLPLVVAPELDKFWIGVSNGKFYDLACCST